MRELTVGSEITLAELPVGRSAVVTRVQPSMRGAKKFADAGVVPGAVLSMESHAPLGSLLRIKLMNSHWALHKSNGHQIMVKLS